MTKLRSLSHLSLRKNLIQEIEAIHELGDVGYLNFRYNVIKDISTLDDYTNHNLTFFYIGFNQVKNITPVKRFNMRGFDYFDPQYDSEE
ncbi:hypothetical protein [Salipaludibacillus sp. CF4.18]|uniref:hypothetical protein n=1 Tax=Salipaludibacillus sp. CF4.18 TaxID=3373081 RepID=UPI003EE51CFB